MNRSCVNGNIRSRSHASQCSGFGYIADPIIRAPHTHRREMIRCRPTLIQRTKSCFWRGWRTGSASRCSNSCAPRRLLELSRPNGRVEGTLAEFARVHREVSIPSCRQSAGRRALLRARLAEVAAKSEAASWRQFFHGPSQAARRRTFA